MWFLHDPAESYTAVSRPKLLDQVRDAIRTRHMSLRTEAAYVHWIKRFILFHGKRHPREMGPPEIIAFLTALAVERHLSASTQSQALAALLFLYREVLGCDPGWLEGIVRAKRPQRLPVSWIAARSRRFSPASKDLAGSWACFSMAPDCAYWNAFGCG